MGIKLTPEKPPYYETKPSNTNVIKTKSDLLVPLNGETLLYMDYTIPKNTMNKSGYGLQIDIWQNVTSSVASPRILINWNGATVQSPSLGNVGLNKLQYTIFYNDTAVAIQLLEGYAGSSLIRQYGLLGGRDWTIDNLIEIKIENTDAVTQLIAATIKTIFPTFNQM